MNTDVEETFATFSVKDRLMFIDGLQAAIMDERSVERAALLADLIIRCGYPESAESALRCRALLVTL